jgi:hypothetical protein
VTRIISSDSTRFYILSKSGDFIGADNISKSCEDAHIQPPFR